MKGGHTDNYYYQLMANIRRYKGVDKPVPQTFKDIAVSENFEQWQNVESIYYDHVGDIEHRNSLKQGNAGPYTDTKGRNDFELAKVAHNNNSVFFYIKTKDETSSYTDKNWMLLLIDTDQNPSTGWNGYDILINNEVKNENTTTLKTYHQKKGWIFFENIITHRSKSF